MAPPIFIACFLSRRVQTALIGNLLLIFFPIMLAPTNPQSYDPNGFVTLSVLGLTASVLVFVLLRAVLPTTDIHRRRWSLQVARADLAKTFNGRTDSAEKRIVVDSHRVAQMPLKQPAQSTAQQRVLQQALALADLDIALAGAVVALRQLSEAPAYDKASSAAYQALTRADAQSLHQGAVSLLAAARSAPESTRRAAAVAVAGLAAASRLITSHKRVLDRLDLRLAS
jgi:hypothetical protein